MSTTRRTILWTTPVVAVAATAPAFAASETACQPSGFKHPGATRAWAYELHPDCTSGTIESVTIDGEPAEQRNSGWWVEFDNSRSTRTVVVKFTDGNHWTGPVFFPPVH